MHAAGWTGSGPRTSASNRRCSTRSRGFGASINRRLAAPRGTGSGATDDRRCGGSFPAGRRTSRAVPVRSSSRARSPRSSDTGVDQGRRSVRVGVTRRARTTIGWPRCRAPSTTSVSRARSARKAASSRGRSRGARGTRRAPRPRAATATVGVRPAPARLIRPGRRAATARRRETRRRARRPGRRPSSRPHREGWQRAPTMPGRTGAQAREACRRTCGVLPKVDVTPPGLPRRNLDRAPKGLAARSARGTLPPGQRSPGRRYGVCPRPSLPPVEDLLDRQMSRSGSGAGAGRSAGVRMKRGAGAGWISRQPRRTCPGRRCADARCASPGASTGATQASVPAKTSVHSSRVRLGEPAVNRARSAGQPAGRTGRAGPVVGEPEAVEQRGVELRLHRADRHEPAVGGLVGVVERRAAVEQVGAALVRATRPPPSSPCRNVVEQRRAVHHRRVDHLAAPGRAPAPAARPARRRRAASPPPPKSPSRLTGGVRRARRPGRCACSAPGHGDVVDVVAGARRQRSVLAPAGHPPVDQPRVARRQHRPGRSPSRSATPGPEPLDQHVGPVDQVQQHGRARPGLEVQRDRAPAAAERAGAPAGRRPAPARRAGPPAPRRRRGRPAACTRTAPARWPAARPPGPRPAARVVPASVRSAVRRAGASDRPARREPVAVALGQLSARARKPAAGAARVVAVDVLQHAAGPRREADAEDRADVGVRRRSAARPRRGSAPSRAPRRTASAPAGPRSGIARPGGR